MKIAYNHNNELICPHCGAEHSYLHHDQVTVYSRNEDSPKVTKIVVRDHLAEISAVDNDTSGNPSSRRDGVAIRMWCELCHAISELTLAQHKGTTQIEWREIGQIAGGPRENLKRHIQGRPRSRLMVLSSLSGRYRKGSATNLRIGGYAALLKLRTRVLAALWMLYRSQSY